MSQGKLGRWAFVVGVVIAVLLGFVTFTYSSVVLVILGLIVGFMNVTEGEAQKFLVAVIALMVIGVAGLQAFSVWGSLYSWIQTVLSSFTVFVGAAGVVVAFKVLFEMGKEG